ncbi:hypothetical protein CIK05_05030 [Bdellovibrio sp. qaytius]|nr:hypothetical protein CIK05_05030 [Bdellovibrio sp. qaytius]
MKHLLMIIAVVGLVQTVKAAEWQNLSENLTLVQEDLNQDIYKFQNKIIHFSMSKNREKAQLQISNNICPKVVGGFSCMAIPAVILNATFTLKHVETDGCGIETYISNNLEVGSRWMQNQRRFAQIRVKDFSKSICEMVYPADVQVELKDTALDSQENKAETHYSSLLFNFLKEIDPVAQ